MPDNLYKRGSTWWGRITVRGKEVRASLRTADKGEARKRLKAWKEKEVGAAHYGDDRVTFSAASEKYLTIVGPKAVKPSTLTRYDCSLTQLAELPVGHKGEELKDLYLDQIDRKVVGRLVNLRRVEEVTEATIRRDLTAGSRVFAAAMADNEEITDNPFLSYMQQASNAGTLRERREPIVLPDLADIERVIERAPGMLAEMIRWAMLTGMRQEEIASLTRRQVNGNAVQLTTTKTSRARAVSLSPAAMDLYRRLPVALKGQWVFWHTHGRDAPCERYENVASRFAAITQSCEAEAQKANRPFRRFRFHDLRHYYAVQYLKDGGSIYDLQKQLGHSSIQTTELYLDYLTPEEQAAAKRGIGLQAAI